MEVTWFGTASIRLRIQELVLLFDPFVPLPKASYSLTAERFLPAPYVFITHGHFDHVYSVPDLVKAGAGNVFATKSPCAALNRKGVSSETLRCIRPNDTFHFSATSGTQVHAASLTSSDTASDLVTVTVRRSRHIRFDVPYVLSTLFNRRVLQYFDNTRTILRENRLFKENNETVLFEISYDNRTVAVLGSLALVDEETYAQGSDLLVLPYQGHSRLKSIALSIIERLKPRRVLLSHFDDSFPPVSRDIDTTPLVEALEQLHPEIQVIIPIRGTVYHF